MDHASQLAKFPSAMQPLSIVEKATRLREKIDDAEYEMSFIQRNLRKNQHKLAALVEAYQIDDCKGVHPSCPCYECHYFRLRKEELVQNKNADYDYNLFPNGSYKGWNFPCQSAHRTTNFLSCTK